MSGFFDKLKDAFGSKKPPKYKIYEAQEIKMIALRTRVILTENREQLLKQIGADDQKFRFVGNDPRETYAVLQSIGEKVIEAESLKIFVEMMRKVENNSSNIAKTNGDIAMLRTEMQWFQCVLWYRRVKQVPKLDDIHNFCLDFFKGVDITKEMDVNCEVFTLFPILKYLKKNDILPLPEILFYLQPYVSCNISKPTLDAIFILNQDDIIKKKDRASLEVPSKVKEPSKIYPNSATFTIPESPTKNSQINPYQIRPPPPNQWPNQSPNKFNNSAIRNPTNSNMGNSNSGNIQANNNFSNPSHNSYIYEGNAMNLSYNQSNQFAPQQPKNPYELNIDNGFAAQNQNYSPYNIPNQPLIDHNPFSGGSKFQQSTFNQPQNNSNYYPPHINKPQPEKKPIIEEKKQPQPVVPPVQQPKKSFFNSLMRANSKEQKKNTNDSACFILPDPSKPGFNIDRERQQNQFVFNETNQSWVPLNRDNFDNFDNNHDYAKEFELQRKRKKEAEELERHAEQQRKAEEQRKEEQQRRAEEQKQAQEAAIRLELQRKIREEEQKRKQEQLQREKKKAQEQERAKREEEARIKAQQERKMIERQEAERKAREEQERREREEEQRERERQLRMREREREEERELNVFVDNEREEIDRGFSGRFSSNMGYKFDMDDYQGEEFGSNPHEAMNSSILRFKKDESPPPAPETVDLSAADEKDSLEFIQSGQGSNANQPYKLFYYKKT